MFVRFGTSPNNKYYPPEKLCSYIFSYSAAVRQAQITFVCWRLNLRNSDLGSGLVEFFRKQGLSMFVSLYLIKTSVTCFVGFRSNDVRRVII